MMNELTLLMAADATTYSRYVQSLLQMQAQAEVTKVRITYATWQFERELKRELKKKGTPR